MQLSEVTLPVFTQMLGSMAAIIDKLADHAGQRKIDPNAFLQARLFPNMYSFARQIKALCDWPVLAITHLTGCKGPAFAAEDLTFEDLKARIKITIEFVNSADVAAYNASQDRDIDLSQGTNKRIMTGRDYLIHRALPQFFFHVTTAYAILRSNGLDLSKADFMGKVPGQRTA